MVSNSKYIAKCYKKLNELDAPLKGWMLTGKICSRDAAQRLSRSN